MSENVSRTRDDLVARLKTVRTVEAELARVKVRIEFRLVVA